MPLLMLILSLVLYSPTACSLQCYMCIPGVTGGGACSETQQSCAAAQQCGAVTIRTYVGDLKMDVNMKTCMSEDQCVSGSMNFGFTRTFLSSSCCSSDLCNVLYSQPPISPSPNGKKCYTCTGNECSNILSCTGDEDRCISGKVTIKGQGPLVVKGCASSSLCVSSESHVIPGGMETQATCCRGDLCNNRAAGGPAHTFVCLLALLLAPLYLLFGSD